MEAHDFRVSFTPLAGVLFTVPSRYCTLSVAACSLPWTVVSPASDQVLRARPYSGTEATTLGGDYATFTRSGAAFQTASSTRVRHRGTHQRPGLGPPTPLAQRLVPLARQWFRHNPVRSPLLRVWFSLPPATEMFQLAGCPPSNARYPPRGMSCLIRKSLDQGLLAAPQSLSERCPVLHRHAAPGHPSCAHHVFPAHWHSAASGRQNAIYDQSYVVSKVHHYQ
jgi:hypothetical protein